MMTEHERIMKEIDDKLDETVTADGFFITITTKKEDMLSHYQARINFPDEDCIPSLDEIRKLIVNENPKMARPRSMQDRKFH